MSEDSNNFCKADKTAYSVYMAINALRIYVAASVDRNL